jgi:hypothetical protein
VIVPTETCSGGGTRGIGYDVSETAVAPNSSTTAQQQCVTATSQPPTTTQCRVFSLPSQPFPVHGSVLSSSALTQHRHHLGTTRANSWCGSTRKGPHFGCLATHGIDGHATDCLAWLLLLACLHTLHHLRHGARCRGAGQTGARSDACLGRPGGGNEIGSNKRETRLAADFLPST